MNTDRPTSDDKATAPKEQPRTRAEAKIDEVMPAHLTFVDWAKMALVIPKRKPQIENPNEIIC